MNPEPQSPASKTTPGPGASPRSAAPPTGVLGTFRLGLRVWAREMRRILATQAQRHERRQLEARLAEEEGLLANMENAAGPERDLCLREIELLEAETARLRAEEASPRTVRTRPHP